MKFLLIALIALLGFLGQSVAATEPIEDIFTVSDDDILVERIPIEVEAVSVGLFTKGDEIKDYYRPVSIQKTLAKKSGIQKMHSKRVLDGESLVIPSGNFLVTKPPKSLQSEWWTAQLVDGQGEQIKEFKGQGNLPQQLSWNGLQEGWNRLKAGEPYNFIYLSKTSQSQVKRVVGEPFTLEAFQQKTNDKVTMTFETSSLFESSNVENLSQRGQDWLLASCHVILKHPGHPISIDVHTKDLGNGTKQKEQLVESISNILMTDAGLIISDLHVDPQENEQVKIHVLGVSNED